LVAALDPFHDNQLPNLAGYPDVVTTPSVIHCIKQSTVLAAPGGAADWCAQIVVYPWALQASLRDQRILSGNRFDSTQAMGTIRLFDNISIRTAAGSGPILLDTAQTAGLSMPVDIMDGLGRVVGMGLEIQNVSSELNTQGSCTTYRMQGSQTKWNSWSRDVTVGGVPHQPGYTTSCFALEHGPETSSQVMLLPGTRSWPAKEGCYMVIPIGQDNQPAIPLPVNPIIPETDWQQVMGGQFVLAPDAANPLNNKLIPCPVTGAIFDGLSALTVLKVQVVWYYEQFPGYRSSLVTLAKPSCEFDPVALQFYTEVLNKLPVAVPSSWNAAGDWFWDVVTAIKDHAAEVGNMLGGAPGKAIGMAASTLAGWGRDRYLTAPGTGGSSAPKKKKPNPNPIKQNLQTAVEPKKKTPQELARMTKEQRREYTMAMQRAAAARKK